MDRTQLPIELVHAILETTAQEYVSECRLWALQLALLDHSIARVLRPILFHSVIIDDRNALYFATPGPSDLALSFARHMSIVPGVNEQAGAAILARWKPAVGSFLYARWYLVREFMNMPEAQALRGVEVRYERLLRAFAGPRNPAPASVAGQLTRVAGYVPLYWTDGDNIRYSIPAHEWATILCDKLPALADLGLDLYQVDPRWAMDAIEHSPDAPSPPEQYLDTLRDVLIALFDIKPQMRICIRVRGQYNVRLRSLVQRVIVEGVPNSRLRLNYDLRRVEDLQAVEALHVQDNWKGRDIWTEIHDLDASMPVGDVI